MSSIKKDETTLDLLTLTIQEECEARLKVLEEAAASAQRMTSHGDADGTVGAFKVIPSFFFT
jgi:hypothetical protein